MQSSATMQTATTATPTIADSTIVGREREQAHLSAFARRAAGCLEPERRVLRGLIHRPEV
jgi:hypothetical protein